MFVPPIVDRRRVTGVDHVGVERLLGVDGDRDGGILYVSSAGSERAPSSPPGRPRLTASLWIVIAPPGMSTTLAPLLEVHT